MATQTTTANLALSHLGFGTEIANLTTEQSEEASALRRFHDTALEVMLREFDWSFTKKYAALALVAAYVSTDPEYKEWSYSYRYPTDCVKIRKIFSGARNDALQTRIPYEVAHDSTGKFILTDLSTPTLIYSRKVTDYNLFPSDFIMAFSLRWALYLPNRLLGGDPFKIKTELYQMYQLELSRAQKNDLMEQTFDVPVESEFIRGRE